MDVHTLIQIFVSATIYANNFDSNESHCLSTTSILFYINSQLLCEIGKYLTDLDNIEIRR